MKKNYAIWIVLIAVLQGGYMLFDGIHKLKTGTYFGGQVGPWAHVVSALGVNVNSMAPVFITLGLLWLAGAVGLLLEAAWAQVLLIVVSIVTLAYPPFGTVLALLALFLLLRGKIRSAALRSSQ